MQIRKRQGITCVARITALLMVACIVLTAVFAASAPSGGNLGTTFAATFRDVTERYAGRLNSASLYDPDTVMSADGLRPQDTDYVDLIVALSGNASVVERYVSASGYKSVYDYSVSKAGVAATSAIRSEQSSFLKRLTDKGVSYTVNTAFSTLLNAVSISTQYKNLAAVEKLSGVRSVRFSRTYMPLEGIAEPVYNDVKVHPDTGIFDSSDVAALGYTGAGTMVAVLDTGFDHSHSVFKALPPSDSLRMRISGVEALLADSKAAALRPYVTAADVYISDKIPFAFDYADNDAEVYPANSEHGTHVAGIIAGNDTVVTGVAVDTQLVLMKVFSDIGSAGAKDEYLLPALEDAVLLGVDVINLSLGTSMGFTRERDNDETNRVYDLVKEAGVNLVVAAANDGSSYRGTANGDTGLLTNADTGTLGSPATYAGALAVGSVSGVKTNYLVADNSLAVYYVNPINPLSDEIKFRTAVEAEWLKTHSALPADNNYPYQVVPGYGQPFNYGEGVNVSGKIAVVSRGDITFEQKRQYAFENGAIGILIYNNVSGSLSLAVSNELTIPTASTNNEFGRQLAARGSGYIKMIAAYEAGPFMSSFSSWGPSPDLSLKPEITAHGGQIKSAVPGGDYEQLSGTSMAAPNMSGAVTLIRQYVRGLPQFANAGDKEIAVAVNQILMSTATTVKNQDGNPYSPRVQGAGLASLSGAVKTPAYVTVEGSDFSKLELFDDPARLGVYEMNIVLRNITGTAVTYRPSIDVITETVSADNKTVAEKSYMLSDYSLTVQWLDSANGSYDDGLITVNGGSSLRVKLVLTLGASTKEYLTRSFENGMFVEGFLKFAPQTTENPVYLSVPYLAFFGDWTDAALWDKDFYETEADRLNASIIEDDKLKADIAPTTPYGAVNSSYLFALGAYIYLQEPGAEDIIPIMDKAAMSIYPGAVTELYGLAAGLLRGASNVKLDVAEENTGRVVQSFDYFNVRKAGYTSNTGAARQSFIEMEHVSPYEMGLINNQRYTMTFTAEMDYDKHEHSSTNTEYTLSFWADYESPSMKSAQVYSKYDKYDKKTKTYLEMYIYDNQYAQSFRLLSMDGTNELVMINNYPTPIRGDRGETAVITYEITDYLEFIYNGRTPDSIFVYVDDYALNYSIFEIPLPTRGAENIDFQDDAVTLSKNQVVTPAYTVAPEGKWGDTLEWLSSDESVARVHRGEIFAVGKGEAVISVSIPDGNGGYLDTASLNVNVLDTGDAGYSPQPDVKVSAMAFSSYETVFSYYSQEFREIGVIGNVRKISSHSMSVFPAESIKIFTEVKPWNIDDNKLQIEWRSSNSKIVTVDGDGVITGVSKGTASITATVRYDGKITAFTDRFTITVGEEFVIRGSTLVAYFGTGDENGHVKIPEEKSISLIGQYAFSNYKYALNADGTYKLDVDKFVILEPVGESLIKSVELSSTVEIIDEYAFYGSKNLTTVTQAPDPNGKEPALRRIGQGAFEACPELAVFDLSDVLSVGLYSFRNTPKLNPGTLSKLSYAGDEAFLGNKTITAIDLTNLGAAGPKAFAECENLASVTLGANTKPGAYMFEKCNKLYSLAIYNPVITPGGVFAGIPNLHTVTFKAKVTVGTNSFQNCPSLTTVSFEQGAVSIGAYAFAGAGSLTTVRIDGTVIIGQGAFAETNLTTLTLGADAELVLDDAAFYGATNLKTVDTSENADYDFENGILYNAAHTEIFVAAANADYNNSAFTVSYVILKIHPGAFAGHRKLISLSFNGSNPALDVGALAFALCPNLKSVTLPTNTTTVFGDGVFKGCASLASARNLNFMKNIPAQAFAETGLLSAEIGDDTTVGVQAFFADIVLASVTLGEYAVIGDEAFALCELLEIVRMPSSVGVRVGAGAFLYNKNLRTIDLSKVTGEIGEGAFRDCVSLTRADLENVTKIGAYAFAFDLLGWYNSQLSLPVLEVVNAPNVTEIGEGAFYENGKITTVTVSNKLKIIGDYAFFGGAVMSGDAIIALPSVADLAIDLSGVEKIGASAFSGSGLKSAELTSLKIMGTEAFSFTAKLSYVSGGDGVKDVPFGAFAESGYTGNLTLATAETVGDRAFYHSQIGEITAPLVKIVGLEAFFEAQSRKILLPSAQVIGLRAFYNAANLTDVADMDDLSYIGDLAFLNTALTSFALSGKLGFMGYGAFEGVRGLTGFELNGSADFTLNNKYFVSDGVLYERLSGGSLLLISYAAGDSDEVYTVLAGTSKIVDNAFSGNRFLKEVYLSYELTAIGDRAFDDCTALSVVHFGSLRAPTLESAFDMAIYESAFFASITDLPPVYDYKYADFFPLYYFNFIGQIGKVRGLTATYPANGSGYDNFIYSKYFDTVTASAAVIEENTRRLIDTIDALGTPVLADGELLKDLRARYDALSDTQKAFVTNIGKLEAAEAAYALLLAGEEKAPDGGDDNRALEIGLGVGLGLGLPLAAGAVLLLLFLKKKGKVGKLGKRSKDTPEPDEAEVPEATEAEATEAGEIEVGETELAEAEAAEAGEIEATEESETAIEATEAEQPENNKNTEPVDTATAGKPSIEVSGDNGDK
ncbi:MAG: leucine-rich repeat protein [Clostridiaceae bacterium]|jgi:lactocepin|nr:leucine-rich repeat protein [Clostridiaceae bacterium]